VEDITELIDADPGTAGLLPVDAVVDMLLDARGSGSGRRARRVIDGLLTCLNHRRVLTPSEVVVIVHQLDAAER
jgi:hypothetical protein